MSETMATLSTLPYFTFATPFNILQRTLNITPDLEESMDLKLLPLPLPPTPPPPTPTLANEIRRSMVFCSPASRYTVRLSSTNNYYYGITTAQASDTVHHVGILSGDWLFRVLSLPNFTRALMSLDYNRKKTVVRMI
jgi:hypothetical protein